MDRQRSHNRQFNQLRPLDFVRNFTRFPTGSVLAKCGDTQVLCTVSISAGVPKFLEGKGQGWLTAEYRMLPGATPQRHPREWQKLSGRTQEIQRLVGRSLRSALDMNILGERTITIDADVIQADAGTRTTAINGGFVALTEAVNKLIEQGELERSPIVHNVGAVSVGILESQAFLDLDYLEDVGADVDLNIVMDEQLQLIEVQGTAEHQSFSRQQLNQMLDLAEIGIKEIFILQNRVILR